MNILFQMFKSIFIQASVETITAQLAKTVSKLDTHAEAAADKRDALHEAIDEAHAAHYENISNMATKAVELTNEAQKAAAIARNISVLLNQ